MYGVTQYDYFFHFFVFIGFILPDGWKQKRLKQLEQLLVRNVVCAVD